VNPTDVLFHDVLCRTTPSAVGRRHPVHDCCLLLTKPVVVVGDFVGRGGVAGTAYQDICFMLQHYDPAGWFLVCSLFHCCVLHSLFDYNLFSVVDIDALGAGLAAQAHTVQRVPCFAVEGHFARLGKAGDGSE